MSGPFENQAQPIALPTVSNKNLPKRIAGFRGQVYTPQLHNEMRQALTIGMTEADARKFVDPDTMIATAVLPQNALAKAIAVEAAKLRARIRLPDKPTGPSQVDRLCNLFDTMDVPQKAPPFDGDYVLCDGKGRAFSVIDAFIEMNRRIESLQARVECLEASR